MKIEIPDINEDYKRATPKDFTVYNILDDILSASEDSGWEPISIIYHTDQGSFFKVRFLNSNGMKNFTIAIIPEDN